MTYRDWPEDTPQRRASLTCTNCRWRSKPVGDLFCAACTPAYERHLAEKKPKGQLAEWDLTVQDHERAVLSKTYAPQPVPTDDAYLIATHRERGAPWDCPAECGCADRDDAVGLL